MISPLTKVLAKIFVRGFYRVHGGMLLFLFVTLITYWFFINVLNETHLTPDERILQNLLLVLTLLSSPVMVVIVFVAWLFFTIKSWDYIISQLALPSNQFLFYSSNAFDKISQLKSWFVIQLLISLPILAYGIFSLVIGVIYDYHAVPILIFLYVMLLALISAFVYVRTTNKLIRANKTSILSRISLGWRKPFFSLFLYHIGDQLKVALVFAKFLSYGIIAGGSYLLQNESNRTQTSEIITLGIVIAHAVIIFQSHRFENFYLSFSRNFPFKRIRTYSSWAFTYLLLTLPENIWLLSTFEPNRGIMMVLFNVSAALLFRNLLYAIIPDMKKYLYRVFYLFLFFFLAILFKVLWIFVLINFLVSFTLHYRHYYRQPLSLNY
jgi:hypothetical protein